jgi:hypothetical protein
MSRERRSLSHTAGRFGWDFVRPFLSDYPL